LLGGGRDERDIQEAAWSNSDCGRVFRSRPCGDCRILGGLAKDFQCLPSRSTVRPDVELHVRRHRHPHMAPFSLRSSRFPCGDRITGLPGVFHCPRGPVVAPLRDSRLLVRPGTRFYVRMTIVAQQFTA